jgi:hypothetical protein
MFARRLIKDTMTTVVLLILYNIGRRNRRLFSPPVSIIVRIRLSLYTIAYRVEY